MPGARIDCIIGPGVRVAPSLSDLGRVADAYIGKRYFLIPAITTDATVYPDYWARNEVYWYCGAVESVYCVIVMVCVDDYAGFVTIYVDFLENFEIFGRFLKVKGFQMLNFAVYTEK